MEDNAVRKIIEFFDGGRRWGQHTFINKAGLACIMGANHEVTPYDHRALYLIKDVVIEQFPERVYNDGTVTGSVGAFNDHPETTWADVDRVLDKAAVMADEAQF